MGNFLAIRQLPIARRKFSQRTTRGTGADGLLPRRPLFFSSTLPKGRNPLALTRAPAFY
jgi:hypothetical protein